MLPCSKGQYQSQKAFTPCQNHFHIQSTNQRMCVCAHTQTRISRLGLAALSLPSLLLALTLASARSRCLSLPATSTSFLSSQKHHLHNAATKINEHGRGKLLLAARRRRIVCRLFCTRRVCRVSKHTSGQVAGSLEMFRYIYHRRACLARRRRPDFCE